MPDATIYVSTVPGQAFQPVPFVGSSSLGSTLSLPAGLWSSFSGSSGAAELQVAGLSFGFAYSHGQLNPLPAAATLGGEAILAIGQDLWESDGTPLGTKELASGLFLQDTLSPPATVTTFQPYAGGLLFSGYRGMYLTDGTAAGTRLIAPATFVYGPQQTPAVLGAQIFFNAYSGGNETLYTATGTTAETPVLSASGTPVLNASDLTVFGTKLLFEAQAAPNDEELWITDGTPAGTGEIPVSAAAAAGAGSYGLSPNDITAAGSHAVFLGNDAAGQTVLWTTDGTAAGTTRLTVAGAPISGFYPAGLTSLGGKAIFVAADATGAQSLWATDGTSAGTAEIAPGLDVTSIAATGTGLAILATKAGGLEVTDGTAAGTHTLAVPDAAATLAPGGLATASGITTFNGTDAAGALAIWSTDGTAAGTKEILSGLQSAAVGPVAVAIVTTPALYIATLRTAFATTGGGAYATPGATLTVTLATNRPVSVGTAAGSPSLSLGNGATAAYAPGLSTASALAFTYTVAAGQDTADLTIGSLALNGATITDSAGDALAATSLAGFSTSDTGIAIQTPASTQTSGGSGSGSGTGGSGGGSGGGGGSTLPLHVLTRPVTFALPGAALLTNVANPILAGSAAAGSVVQLFNGQSPAGTAAAASGDWQATLSVATPGVNAITAQSTGPGSFSSLPSGTALVDILSSPVAGITSANVTSADLAATLGAGFGMQFAPGTASVALLDGTINAGTDTSIAYVARLYRGLFGAVPDSGNLGIWTNALDAGQSRVDVANGFLAAPATAATAALPGDAFIGQLFQGFLGHAPDAGQLATYRQLMAGGATRAGVLAGIAGSAEAQAAAAAQTSALFVADSAQQSGESLFVTALGRESTLADVQGLATALRGGVSLALLAQQFTTTPEYLGLHTGQSDAAYVASLYGAGLGRAPSTAESAADTALLGSGTSRAALLAGVAGSAEALLHISHPL